MNIWRGRNSAKIQILVMLVSLLSSGCTLNNVALTTPTATVAPTATPSTPVPPVSSPTITFTSTPHPTSTVRPTIAALNNVPSRTPTITRTPLRHHNDILPTIIRTATSPPISGITCLVSSSNLNLREGPGQNYRIITTLPSGSNLLAHKQIAGHTWLLVSTPLHHVGWVYTSLVNCRDNPGSLPLAHNVPDEIPPSPTPGPTKVLETATPTTTPLPPLPTERWRAEYYDNASLLGNPVLVREDEEINFNWMLDSPAPGVPSDNFSVRWTGLFNFPGSGDYRFYAKVDDGIRLYVDGWLIIDAWQTALPVDYFGDFADLEPGLHTVTVEYFESGGYANAKVWAEEGSFGASHWHGKYYNNSNFHEPFKLIRNDGAIDFNWKHDSPDKQLDSDNFSIRWKRRVPLNFGDYKFYAEVEENDWVRASIDGWTIFEKRTNGDETVTGHFARLGGGDHTILVEFQEHGGKAKIKFWWKRQ